MRVNSNSRRSPLARQSYLASLASALVEGLIPVFEDREIGVRHQTDNLEYAAELSA